MSAPQYIIADTQNRTVRKASRPSVSFNTRSFQPRDKRHAARILAELESQGFTFKQPEKRLPRLPAPKLAAVTCFYNPASFQTLRENYDRFAEQFTQPGWPPLFTVEIALPGQEFSIPAGPRVLQLRAQHALWFKENAINIAARHRDFIPSEFTGIAWLDCDLLFENQAWATEAAEKLRDVPAVQCFQSITHLDRAGDPIQTRKGVVAHLSELEEFPRKFGDCPPGGAWAAHREFFDRFGLYEKFITGGGDAMAHSAMMQHLEPHYLKGFENDALAKDYTRWACPVARHIRGQVDYVPGNIKHIWHGDREHRQYRERRYYLHDMNPAEDLHHNEETDLIEWATNKPELHRRHVEYFQNRREDG